MNEWIQAVVRERRQETEDIHSFLLEPQEGTVLPRFSAGAHVEVKIGKFVRHYSIANSPAEQGRYLLGVLRDQGGRGGSLTMCRDAQVGQTISIRGPHNNFPLADDDGFVLLLAGGIGITPMMSMAEELSAGGRPFSLHHCVRSPESTAFKDRLARSGFADNIVYHYDSLSEGGRPDLLSILRDPPHKAHLYVCGPEPMIAAVVDTARGCGWDASYIHVEHFGASAQTHEPNKPFLVKLKSTGQVIDVRAEQSVVQALRAVGVKIETSCSEGYCGFCITNVIEGVPEHRDTVLSDEEHESNELFTPCCSRAKSEMLVIDL